MLDCLIFIEVVRQFFYNQKFKNIVYKEDEKLLKT